MQTWMAWTLLIMVGFIALWIIRVGQALSQTYARLNKRPKFSEPQRGGTAGFQRLFRTRFNVSD